MHRMVLLALSLISLSPAYAFNVTTHHQILRSALTYLRTHGTQHAQTVGWIKQPFFERTLARTLVDADYYDDLWLDAWYYRPFAGGRDGTFSMLTSLYHFTNVTKPGSYWRYDGYAYQNTDGLGLDALLQRVDI